MDQSKELYRLKLKSKCADPKELHRGSKRVKNLQVVSELILKKLPFLNLSKEHRLCKQCRQNLDKLASNAESLSSSASNDTSSQSDMEILKLADDSSIGEKEELYMDPIAINESLHAIGESPIKKDKLHSRKSYASKKLNKISDSMKRKFENLKGSSITLQEPCTSSLNSKVDDFEELLNQLKNKFESVSKRSEKIKILTLLPRSWSVRKTAAEFNATRYMASVARNLFNEHGCMADPNPKYGKRLAQDVADKITSFYLSEDVSRIMPGRKDFVSIILDGTRQHIQKQLVLCNLMEAYQLFKERYPEIKIGFSKFAELRPKQCILAGCAGTHSVCVCTIHQNMKLLHHGAHFDKLFENADYNINHPRDWLKIIQCNPPNVECRIGSCKNCGDFTHIRTIIQNVFDNHQIDYIEYKKWTTTDRSTLESLMLNIDEFIETFILTLQVYQRHDFIAKMQSSSYKNFKESLKPGEVLVQGDFAENYSAVMQDEVQSFHWNNLMTTIHPFVIYYLNGDIIAHKSYVIISECNIHDTVAVHLFQRYLIKYIKENIVGIKKIIYFSDGCAGQYKNRKNFINLCHHKHDFNIDAEWHFFATSHGKGPCDGVGGTIKRLAHKASLQRPYENQIITPLQLHQFASENIPNIMCQYTTIKEYNDEKTILEDRFSECKTIAGTQKLHCFKPVSETKIEVREYSSSSFSRVESLLLQKETTHDRIINGYVTVVYDSKWWLAVILVPDSESDLVEEIEVGFLHPHGPNPSFVYPQSPDKLTMSQNDILTKVEPITKTGRTYTLNDLEQRKATNALRQYLKI